jgi:hypothetical protein
MKAQILLDYLCVSSIFNRECNFSSLKSSGSYLDTLTLCILEVRELSGK